MQPYPLTVESPPEFQGIKRALIYQPGWGSPTRPARLADDEYFVVGDSIVLANDSRYRNGGTAIKKSQIIGVAVVRYAPFWRFDRLRPAEK